MDEAFSFPGIILLRMLSHPQIGLTLCEMSKSSRSGCFSQKREFCGVGEFGTTPELVW